ncbi:hypothetical protein NEUTE1DRAFT_60578 [Neurospora tetrasperma FGSC 2508]|uniref:Cyclin N-terminal domain-containing protein n=1 Tax=Neurospora tetrasperma (strain FGSC 2508 / ATCC MYA-4615 / P0657) TaxID=510951 RepID=F8MFS2_NEUT8|nr:uncharacterized protein NEUTE1DRAFT_60578 [Neurospora tetrasperma FGSC 2508]EGO59298.1 hypothetical protein NEUTE1DRAFT_60578 [Neurospora tetrasperma FGSC 2508]EGZ73419.1 hypothetical protein NEUTE2DRAFT_107960 [Neurospora tetrasperma FGSC 2509]
MAPSIPTEPASKRNGVNDHEVVPIGPSPGLSSNPPRYISEQTLQQMLKSIGYDEAREDAYRLKGVQLIDSVRQSISLCEPIASKLYLRILLTSATGRAEYNYEDVALASLFVACKVEDTIKKSKDVLCAAHNIRQPHDQRTPDDKMFDGPSKFTVGLERHILETIGFDFQAQYPQKLLIKLLRKMFPKGEKKDNPEVKKFITDAYDMSIDLYKTFAPLKQPSFPLVMAILELTVLLTGMGGDHIPQFYADRYPARKGCVLEVMLDLMDLYTQFPKSTKVGSRYDLNKLMDVKIDINKMLSGNRYHRHFAWCDKCAQDSSDALSVTPGSAISPATNSSLPGNITVKRNGKSSEGTLRFVFDHEDARFERETVAEYFDDVYEEIEEEVEERIPDEPRHSSRSAHHSHSSHRNHTDHGWSPYSRSRHGGHNSDRHKGRKSHGYY